MGEHGRVIHAPGMKFGAAYIAYGLALRETVVHAMIMDKTKLQDDKRNHGSVETQLSTYISSAIDYSGTSPGYQVTLNAIRWSEDTSCRVLRTLA